MPDAIYLCKCMHVTHGSVRAAIEDGDDLAAIQARLGCGNSCGSCLPEVHRMLGRPPPVLRRLAVPAGVAVLGAGAMLLPPAERMLAIGPANTGHEPLHCDECHQPAAGTTRQQLQANARWLLGLRETPVSFAHRPVSNRACAGCHDRHGEDRHPTFRFKEARFADAREAIAPQFCVSCHREHAGGRVTLPGDYCGHCHQEFEIEEDVLQPGHQALADAERFETCLRCHDFHGNHRYDVPDRLDDAFPLAAVQAFLDGGGPSPYGVDKRFGDEPGRDAKRSD